MDSFKFTPYLKSVIWGGDKIAALKHIDVSATDIGESWEISGVAGCETRVAEGPDSGLTLSELIARYRERLVGKKVWDAFGTSFPLLVKIIDARADLSVQVHPDDELAARRHGCAGKTEMWYILDTEPGARIYAGLSADLTPASYRKAVESNTIMDYIKAHDSKPGDTFFLPAGRVHAIGAGNLLLEIQQTSDITYRIYDYDRRDANGNPRELHTEQAVDAIDYRVFPEYKSAAIGIAPGVKSLAACKYFDVRLHNIVKPEAVGYADGSFVIVCCVSGKISVSTRQGNAVSVSCGESVLVPAERDMLIIDGSGEAVTAFVP
ncbi:MAG: class I mannose-6-phosphate isomerase [Muribaculaceae bacterium]|nr:class I mannose-6-phosphate isomerase [Muribaculaceae bacterium]